MEPKHPIVLTVSVSHDECKDEYFNSEDIDKTDWLAFDVEFKQSSTTKIKTLRGQEFTLKDQMTCVFHFASLMPDLFDDETDFITALSNTLSRNMDELHEIDADASSYVVPYLTSYAKKVLANRGVEYEDKLIEIKARFNQIVTTMREERDEDSMDSCCPICLDDLSARGGECTKTLCSHIYHECCILQWLKLNNTCPVCRRKIRTYDS